MGYWCFDENVEICVLDDVWCVLFGGFVVVGGFFDWLFFERSDWWICCVLVFDWWYWVFGVWLL